MEEGDILYYKVELPNKEALDKWHDILRDIQAKEKGFVGSGIEPLLYQNSNAIYFSYLIGQPSHPSVKRIPVYDLVKGFEDTLTKASLKWQRFDLGEVLKQVKPKQKVGYKKLEEGIDLMIQFDKRGGLVPVITQDYNTKEVLMLAYANKEALEKTIETGLATYWSTSRNELWTKGLTSGDKMKIKEIRVDCDQDAILYFVDPIGGACHTKNATGKTRDTCFYRKLSKDKKSLEFIEGMK